MLRFPSSMLFRLGVTCHARKKTRKALGHILHEVPILHALVSYNLTHPDVFHLRGPVAILIISRDACDDSIAKLFYACFSWGIAQSPRDKLQNGLSHRCACVRLSTKGGLPEHFGRSANLLERESRDMGYRSNSIATSRGMRPPIYTEQTDTEGLGHKLLLTPSGDPPQKP